MRSLTRTLANCLNEDTSVNIDAITPFLSASIGKLPKFSASEPLLKGGNVSTLFTCFFVLSKICLWPKRIFVWSKYGLCCGFWELEKSIWLTWKKIDNFFHFFFENLHPSLEKTLHPSHPGARSKRGQNGAQKMWSSDLGELRK